MTSNCDVVWDCRLNQECPTITITLHFYASIFLIYEFDLTEYSLFDFVRYCTDISRDAHAGSHKYESQWKYEWKLEFEFKWKWKWK